MRILLHAPVDFAKPGGVESHVLALAGELGSRGHEVEVHGIGVPEDPRYRAVGEVRSGRYDVLHHHAGPWDRALEAGRPVVHTLHFCVAAKMETYVRIGRWRTLLNAANWRARAAERRIARGPGALIAVSERVRKDFERLHGLAPGRARVIPNGASFRPPRLGRAEWRARHGIPEDTPVLLTVGRHDFVKGYGLLERAWTRLERSAPRAIWVQVGGAGPARSPRRLVTGPLPREDVAEWIHAADVGALPSYYEGCSVALIEMLAGGLPTLAHDVGNAAEVIRPGWNGDLVGPSPGAWTRALRERLGRAPERAPAGFDHAFSWESITDRVEEVYRTAIASRS
jgi:glycosyltransferase involved in cell wall biosynthesis